MALNALFTPSCISAGMTAGSKKQLLQELTVLATHCPHVKAANVNARDLLSAVLERERLGTTGIGSGVAIPHARVAGLKHMSAVFTRLETPLEYESIDDRPVDLVVMLLAPLDAGAEHLRALARVSRILRREDMRARLRAAPNAESLYSLLIEGQESSAA